MAAFHLIYAESPYRLWYGSAQVEQVQVEPLNLLAH